MSYRRWCQADDDEMRRSIDEALAGLGSADVQTLARRSAFAGAVPIEQRADAISRRFAADLAARSL